MRQITADLDKISSYLIIKYIKN